MVMGPRAGRKAIRSIGIVIAVLAQAPSAYARETDKPTAEASAGARLALGREIAQLLNSEAVIAVQLRRLFDETFPAVFAKDPDMAALEKRHPGITRHAIEAMRAETVRDTVTKLPLIWDRLAPIVADALTEEEMRAALTFYRSPTGVWLVETMANNTDFAGPVARMLASGDTTVTAGDLQTVVIDSAKGAVASGMTPERGQAIVTFGLSPAGRKLRALQPKLLEASAAIANQRDPKADARIDRIVQEAMSDFIARHGEKP